jgi:hypothetical protein
VLRRAFLLSVALALVSCAVIENPSGGPKDETPPKVLGIEPAPGSAGVDRSSSIRITFSEKIDGDSFKKVVQVYPPLEFDRMGAKGEVFEIRFKEELPETTICVVIRKGYTDHHRVKGKRDISFCFATADSIDGGTISGRILFKMAPDSTGLVKLTAVSAVDSSGDVTRALESRVASCAWDGSFKLGALPTDGTQFRLWAFTDRNGDMRFSPGDEFYTVIEDTFRLVPDAPSIAGIEINIIDPDEPGTIDGKIEDLTASGIAPTARFDPLFEDGAPLVVRADSTGLYRVMAIPPGDYTMTAFIDLLADSIPGSYPDPADSTRTVLEPFTVLPDTIIISPGSSLTLDPVYIGKDEGGDE